MLKGMKNVVIAVLAAGALASGAAVVADAASSGSSGSSRGGADQSAPSPPGRNGIPPQRPDEKVLTGDTADKVRAAALKKVPGASVLRVETDADGSAYEAHLRKSDGSMVTAKVNKQFEVTAVKKGCGGGPGGRPPGGARPGGGASYGVPAVPSVAS